MSERKPPKMSRMPKTAKDPVAIRLERFLCRQGCAPQPDGTWPVNWSDAINFAKQETAIGKKLTGPFKDLSVNVLQEVRRLKHTCPGCGELIGRELITKSPHLIAQKRGDFLWHRECVDPRREDHKEDHAALKDLRDCVEDAESDLKALVATVLASRVDTTSGYRLKVMALELRDKYSESPYWKE